MPPDDPGAQALFKALWPSDDAAVRRQLQALMARPTDGLTAVEAEVFFRALSVVAQSIERPPAGEATPLAIVARAHGRRLAARFADDAFVQCARVGSEIAVTNGTRLYDRFTDVDRAEAREASIAFFERAVRGDLPTAAAPGVLHSTLGQRLLDRGFARLPDMAAAAVDFEAGARHLLDAGATRIDDRNIADWRRYAFMLDKVPAAQRLQIARRLVGHVEQKRAGRVARSGPELEVYLHVLDVAGNAAVATGQGKEAVALYQRQLAVAQQLRKVEPSDPNHEVMEAFAHLLVGDAFRLAREPRAAWFAYEDARRTYERCGPNAKDMLDMQEFAKELGARQDALR